MRKKSILFLAALCGILSACGTTRKISEVGLREPSSVVAGDESAALSPLRQNFKQLGHLKAPCSAHFGEALRNIVPQRLELAGCPENLPTLAQSTNAFLSLEERSLVEGLIGSNCQGLVSASESLENFLHSYSSGGPLGRHQSNFSSADGTEAHEALVGLKASLQEIINLNLPLEKRLKEHGEYVFPESYLPFLWSLVHDRSCRVRDEDFDRSYRYLQTMEYLERLLPQGPQRVALHDALEEWQKILDEKVTEFFHPRKE